MALYRKYRPASFAEVVGQEHVTEPLSVALESGRINHAYLFSGPRGCGKTSSARILARSLNCEQGPTPTPCGVCASCVALAPGGPGNLDVTELDAASHGGVDDTRDLRERAFFAPASSRYRVLIIDEAHMVTNAGFNALLKIVEEPPEHLIFVFATTEPEKVLPTIRSRTHHYPFRLLTPTAMRGLVERICEQEGVSVDPAVLPLVIRAGGGSPRDTLSVLDQLMAGADSGGITYPRAVALLGATEASLIDSSVDALAAGDGASLFRTVDRVIEAGHDPRRFAADLLQRLRDLIMVQSVPQAVERGLVDAPGEQAEILGRQAEQLGPATLARCADMVHEGMASMRGATSPRLLLEILCARLLLPAADGSHEALLQRVEQLERGVSAAPAGGSAGAPVSASPAAQPAEGPGRGSGDGGGEPARRFVRRSQRVGSGESAPDEPGTAGGAPADVTPGQAPAETSEPSGAAAPIVAPADIAPATTAATGAAGRHGDGEPDAGDRGDAGPAPRVADETPRTTEPTAGPSAGPSAGSPASEEPAPEPAPSEGPSASRPAEPAGSGSEPAGSAPARSEDPAGPTRDDAAVPTRTPEPATGERSIEAEDVRRAWNEIRSAVRARTRTVEVMLAGATVAGVDGRIVHLVHDYAPLAKRLAQPHNATVIAEAIGGVLGGEWSIRCTTGGPAPAAAAAPVSPEQAPPSRWDREPARDPAPGTPADAGPAGERGWERRVRDAGRGTPQGGGARTAGGSGAGGWDDVPPPEEPEPEPGEPDAPPVSEDDMIAEARSGPQNRDHRTAEEIALELLREHLGARPVDR